MELPDFTKYTNRFSKTGFIDKIQRIAKRAGAKLVYAALILFYSMESDKISIKDKAIIIGALGYLITPLDVIPDAIPITGLGDDLAVLIYVLHKIWGEVDEDVKNKAHKKLSQWFDEDEMKAADNLFSKDKLDDPI
ncbi:UNVERIFIED_CONTAM: YkvA family protein [Prevotella sp. 15_C9]